MRARAAAVRTLAAAGFGLAVWAGGVAPASADPVLPVDPAIPLPVPVDAAAPPAVDPAVAPADPAAAPATAAAPQTLLGQFAQTGQSNPLAIMQDLLAGSPQPAAVGLGALPPGTDSTGPGTDPWSLAQWLNPRNFRMPTSDQASPYALSPNDNPSLFDRVNAFKGVHALAHSNLGRMPGSELGQALPGTAPPPGTNIPAGLEQYYVDPAAALPPATVPSVEQLLLPTVTAPN
jgi:hypothetical protein